MFILRIKGKCKNCGATVEQSASDVIYHNDFKEAMAVFEKRRGNVQVGMDNHECSELESGVVETLSYKLD